MTIVGFVILVVLALLLIWVFTKLGSIPGQKAAERGHPQAEAINVLGWVGLLCGAVPWVVALVWAYTKPSGAPPADTSMPTVTEDSRAEG